MCEISVIYKIVPRGVWLAAAEKGSFEGAPVDREDGYIHFSAADQVAETAARHFAGQRDLLLVAVDAQALGGRLRWEPSRNNALFPHLYGALPMDAVLWTAPVTTLPDGSHSLPALER